MPEDAEYQHTQQGTLIIFAVTAVILILFLSGIIFGFVWVTVFVACIMALLLAFFSTLTVSVSRDAIRLWFGPIRVVRKSWPLPEIVSVKTVRNHWYYGWGIRWTPHGPLYNISGLEAVEIALVSGRRFRVGTDEPVTLKHAIEKAQFGGHIPG